MQLPQHTCVQLLADVAEALRPCIAGFTDAQTLADIDASIEQSKRTVPGNFPRSDLRELSNKATRLSGKAELFSQGILVNEASRNSPLGQLSTEQLKMVRDVADLAARSLRAATGDDANANDECLEGLSWAFDLAERLGDDKVLKKIQSLVDNAISDQVDEDG